MSDFPRGVRLRRYIAFLRAINVGGRTVKMDHLRAIFAEMGFGGVETFIASGNVIFESDNSDSDALALRIERRLKDALGFAVETFLRPPAEVARIAEYQPFGSLAEGDPGHTLSVTFMKAPLGGEAQQRLATLQSPTDEFHCQGLEIYWLCRGRISESKAGAQLGRLLGTRGTMRNITTVRKLAAKYHVP